MSATRRRIVATIDQMGTPNKFAQALRDTVIPLVSRLAPFQHAFVQRLSELGITYEGSPIIDGAGERYFDDSIRGGQGIRSRFLLFLGDAAEATTIAAAQKLAASLDDVVEVRSSHRQGLTLVRPDGYVAYEARHSSAAEIQTVHALLKTQTAPARDAERMADGCPAA
jgi:2-polyprenyl-6-methoxyphenol hydroxylase-like FAD-dependent oxidoreductase